MARDAAEWLEKHAAALPHGDDQGALLGLHDDHAQPLEDAGRRATARTSRSAPSSLLDRTEAATRPVRLLGVSVHNLEDPSAPFEPEEPLLPF